MRFFSNDKDARDDQQAVDVQDRAEEVNPDQAHDDRSRDEQDPDRTGFPEHVQSDPVAVPQQRAGSPWSSTPDTADPDLADRERRDDTADATPDDRDGDAPPFHEPAAQPTAFGAATVGGAVAASAAAGPAEDRWDDTDRRSDAASGVADDGSVAPGDGVIDDRDGVAADRVADDRDGTLDERPAGATAVTPGDEADRQADDTGGDATRVDDSAVDATAVEHTAGPEDGRRDDPVDVALDDRGTFDDPQVLDRETARQDTTPPDHAAADTSPDTIAAPYAGTHDPDETSDTVTSPVATLRDDGGFDDPKAVDPATDQPLEDTTPVAAAAAGGPAAAAGMAGAASAGDTDAAGNHLPGTVDAPSLGRLFGDDAGSFRERWRELQLRFVDSPKEATADAAALVDEVVDKLAASLKSQRAALTGDGSEDTEQLRVELRAYRDFVNRLLDL
ncbi:MAG TPA: hypothetical protein VFH03_11790 [Actinoplanes sp.]|nr:hypothetical protein [Actinoplanes sp.]